MTASIAVSGGISHWDYLLSHFVNHFCHKRFAFERCFSNGT
ncbi:MAG: hypothetical protein SOS93_01700 [Mannheimia varigena]|nr:hypothetical protein [Mannheimia varigena]